jgi:hypothetical protein
MSRVFDGGVIAFEIVEFRKEDWMMSLLLMGTAFALTFSLVQVLRSRKKAWLIW